MKSTLHVLAIMFIASFGILQAQIEFVEHANPTGDQCFNIRKGADGKIYVCSTRGQVFVFDGSEWSTIAIPGAWLDDEINDVAVSADGTVWMATRNYGVVKYDGIDFIYYNKENSGIGENIINDIAISASGKVYATSQDYFNIFDGSWTNVHNEDNDIFTNYFGDIEIEGEKVWFSNYYNLVSYENGVFTSYPIGDLEGVDGLFDNISDIKLIQDGTIMIAYSDGIARFKNGEGWKVADFEEKDCNSIAVESPTVFWSFTRLGHGFFSYNNGTIVSYNIGDYPFIVSSDSYMTEGNNGDIWVTNRLGKIYQLINMINVEDNDNDGFASGIDCNDNDPAINPGAYDIANNGIDENCDGIDNVFISGCWSDFTGLFKATTTTFSQDAGIQWDDCNSVWEGTLYFEEDTEGSNSYIVYTINSEIGETFEDITMGAYYACYGTDAQQNLPSGEGVAYLRFEPTCDGISIAGTSQWGEVYSVDSITFNSTQVSFNWSNDYGEGAMVVLERQDGSQFIMYDEDQDGYSSDVDCDDTNSNVNPGATEIANNDIDEDCNGEDLLNKTIDLATSNYRVFPNPVSNTLIIENLESVSSNKKISIYNLQGNLVKSFNSNESNISLLVHEFNAGAYILEIIESQNDEVVRGIFIKI